MEWLLLLHQIPPNPPYLRAKVMKRLTQLGALGVKNSAYLLPHSDDSVEDFEWLRREIQQGGGEGWVFRCAAVSGLSDASIQDNFRRLRAADYAALAAEARAVLDSPAGPAFQKLKRRYEDVRSIDFFDAAGRQEMEILMNELERVLHSGEAPVAAPNQYQGRVWVTRRGIKVDRIGQEERVGQHR